MAVEGEEIIQCTHDQVVDKIRQCGNRCCLLVVDAETDKMCKMVRFSLNSVHSDDLTRAFLFYAER